jgi:hypothetical protein
MTDDAGIVDAILARAELPVTEQERARLIRLYPAIVDMTRRLRIPEAHEAEPAVIYSPAARRS